MISVLVIPIIFIGGAVFARFRQVLEREKYKKRYLRGYPRPI